MNDSECSFPTDEQRQGGASPSVPCSPSVVNADVVTRRRVLAAVLVACVLPTVLLAGVCSYVHHEFQLINSQLHHVMRNCGCRHPIASVDRLSQPVSPAQVSLSTISRTYVEIRASLQAISRALY